MNTLDTKQATNRDRPSPQAATPPITSTVAARQGVTGHNVRYVLTFGLVGAICALGFAYLIFVR